MTRDSSGSDITSQGRFSFVAKHSTLVAKSVLFASLLVTMMAWYFVKGNIEEKARERFDSQVQSMTGTINQRMLEYESVLRGGVGLLQASEVVSRDEWRTYAETLDVLNVFPGIQGIGYAVVLTPDNLEGFVRGVQKNGLQEFLVSPDGSRPVYSSVLFLEPSNEFNQQVLGYDMLTDPALREAMLDAAVSKRAVATDRVNGLNGARGADLPDMFMYMPVYDTASVPAEMALDAELGSNVKGFVFAAFHMEQLVQDMLGTSLQNIRLELYDGEQADPQSLLFDSQNQTQRQVSATQTVTVAGRSWTLVFSCARLISENESLQPHYVAIGGVLIDFLLFAVLMLISKRRESAERLAASMTEELTELNAAMKASNVRLNSAFENMATGVIVCDQSGVIEIFNSSAVKMFGYELDEVIGKNLTMLMPPNYAKEHPGYLSHYLSTGERKIIGIGRDVVGLRKNGDSFPIHLGVGEINVDGKRSFVGSVTDLSEIRALESQLMQSQRMDAIGQLTGGVAHDFNNIMMVIMGSAELLGDQKDLNEDSKRYVKDILRSVDSGAALTNMLLAFTRQQKLTPKVVQLDQVIASVSSLISRTMGERVELKVTAEADVRKCLIDPAQFEHALINLCINARDAMVDGGSVTIESRNENLDGAQYGTLENVEPGHYVAVKVIDSGMGIESAALDRVLEPFYTTKPEGKGTGLGLSMVYGFVKQSGGYISIESEVGKGTSITMLFPVTMAELPGGEVEQQDADLRGSEKILVVEDDPAVRQLPVQILSRQGYEVYEAEDGESALVQLSTNGPFDLLFTDAVLPGEMHGVKLAISARARQPGLKVLFTSGYIKPEMMNELPADNQDPLLRKPYMSTQLLQSVRGLLSV